MRSSIGILALALAACNASTGSTDAGGSGSSSGGGSSGGLVPMSCDVGGLDFPSGAANPADPCQLCEPATDASAWTLKSCPAPLICSGGTCVSRSTDGGSSVDGGSSTDGGSTVDGGSSDSGCVIPDAGSYPAGTTNPSNPCQSCQPSVSQDNWTPISGLAPSGGCGSEDVCNDGNCAPGCWIDGGFVASGAFVAGNACESCQPASSNSAWTPLSGPAPDAGCGLAEVCNAGSCASGCWLDGAFFAGGAVQTGNACQVCVPSTSTIGWTGVTGLPPDGGCTPGQVCNAGACAGGCFIDGGYLLPGAADPAHTCRTCVPATSVQVWVNGFTSWTGIGSAPEIVVVADINGDSKPDLVMANSEATPFLNEGNGKFAPDVPVPLSGAPNSGVVVPPVSGSFATLYFSDGSNSASYAKGATSPFTACTSGGSTVPCALALGAANADSTAVAAGDFDPSGKPGLAVADLASLSIDCFSSAALTTDAYTTFSLGIPTAQDLILASGDFNGDNIDDLAVGYNAGQVETVQLWLALPDGGGFTNVGNAFAGPGASGQLAVADFNRDGNLDLALANGSSLIQVAFGDGTGQFAPPVNYLIGSGSTTLVAGDFNADGWPDLAVANATDKTIALLYNQGDGTFSEPLVVYTCPGTPNSLAASDWVPPNAGSSYGSPTTVLGATDEAGTVLGLVNSCQ